MIAAHFALGKRGTIGHRPQDGWSEPEDGFTWSIGTSSRLRAALPDGVGQAFLELELNPFVVPGQFSSQVLRVRVNGVPVGEDRLVGEGTVGYTIPDHAIGADRGVLIELEHPDARCPAEFGLQDGRRLGFMLRGVRLVLARRQARVDAVALPPLQIPRIRDAMGRAVTAITGLDPPGLVRCFESLGSNCEFGLVQRQFGAEPLGMLRFAGITLDDVLNGLRHGFAGIGERVRVDSLPAGNGRLEFVVQEERYRIGLHSFRSPEDTTAEKVLEEHGRRLRFLHAHFIERLQTGERIFVFQRRGQITRSQAVPLLTLLQDYGPNGLLYVDQDPGLPAGAVEQLGHGFYHGKLDQMAPAEDAGRADLLGWLSLCANAHRLWRAARAQ